MRADAISQLALQDSVTATPDDGNGQDARALCVGAVGRKRILEALYTTCVGHSSHGLG